MPKLAKLASYFPDPKSPAIREMFKDEDWFLVSHVPTDSEATESRARAEAAAHLRSGEPYVTLHCAPLKLPSGIKGERWYVLTPALHRLIPSAEASWFREKITSPAGGTDGQTEGRNRRIAKKKAGRKAGKQTGKQAGRKTRKRRSAAGRRR